MTDFSFLSYLRSASFQGLVDYDGDSDEELDGEEEEDEEGDSAAPQQKKARLA